VDSPKVLRECVLPVCRSLVKEGQRYRALQPFGADTALLETIGRGEFNLAGFRNRDLQQHLFDTPAGSDAERKKRSARITRKLRLLRGHGLIRKVPKTHRYQLTGKGRELVVALSAAAQANIRQLTALAA
jgi:hypothetical protein